jgi:hypothetical protein
MSGTQQLVGVAGAGLIVVNAWTGPQRTRLGAITGSSGSTDDAHAAVKEIGVEVLGVGALTLLAGLGGNGARAAVYVLGALWLVWLMRRAGKTPAKAKPSTPPVHLLVP